MGEKIYPTNSLYVVNPSIVVSDNTTYSFRELMDKRIVLKRPVSKKESRLMASKGINLPETSLSQNIKWHLSEIMYEKAKALNINHVTHEVLFEQRTSDITIAVSNNSIYKDLLSDERIVSDVDLHICEGEKCVGVVENDAISLVRYLFEQELKKTQYNNEIERYIMSLKPFYTIEEIIDILTQIKSTIIDPEEVKRFSLTYKTTQPIFSKSIYTDLC